MWWQLWQKGCTLAMILLPVYGHSETVQTSLVINSWPVFQSVTWKQNHVVITITSWTITRDKSCKHSCYISWCHFHCSNNTVLSLKMILEKHFSILMKSTSKFSTLSDCFNNRPFYSKLFLIIIITWILKQAASLTSIKTLLYLLFWLKNLFKRKFLWYIHPGQLTLKKISHLHMKARMYP